MTVEELKWKKFPVSNDGFVCLVDVMGDDAAVAQAARTSYGIG
jgi:thymidylate synthase (FAD)